MLYGLHNIYYYYTTEFITRWGFMIPEKLMVSILDLTLKFSWNELWSLNEFQNESIGSGESFSH